MNVYSISIKGARSQNEDKHIIHTNLYGGSNNKNNSNKKINFYAVYDGHGGKGVSTYLSESLAKYFIDDKVLYPISKKYVVDVYDHLQTNLSKFSYAKHSGSTALVVIHYKIDNEDFLNIINTGDSRCVLCRENFAIPLTKDHKPNWPEEQYRIESLGGVIIHDGSDWRIRDLSVSRAFGDFDATPYVTHRPDLFRYKLDKYDKFLVIACDGLWDVLTNFEVVNFILLKCYDKTLKRRIKILNIASQLAEYALMKGSTDNITIIIVFFD